MMAHCKECRHFRYYLERTRDIPCTSYEEMRKQDERRKRDNSFGSGAGCDLAGAAGTAPEAEEKGLSAAAGLDHEPDPAGDSNGRSGGDIHFMAMIGERR